MLASLTHLFGLVLATASILVLMVRGRIRPLRGLIGLAVIALPEAIWIIHGKIFVPKFAAGAAWNDSPDLDAVNQLLQDVFAWGRPSMADGGFVWDTPAGLWLGIAVLLVALNRLWTRPRTTGGQPDQPALRASISLSLLAVLVIVSSWSVSQITPLWTPRNLIIVDPAIRMALALLVVSASRSRWIRTLLSSTLIVLLTLGLGTVASANRNPWKTDFRDAVKLVVTTRKYHPGVQIAGDVSPWWAFGNAAHPKDPRLVKQLTADHHVSRETFPDGVHLHGHDVLWLMYLGPSSSNAANSRIMVNAASPTQCRPIDITGILAMYCTARK